MPEFSDVSVVIPTYNRKSLLPRAVLCVARQTLPPKEIIIVDDGSTDGTDLALPAIREYLSRSNSKNISLIYHRIDTNKGANFARNKGISLASSRHIAFLDSDDIWHERKLETQLSQKYIDLNNSKLIFTDRVRIDENHDIIGYGCAPFDTVTFDNILISNKIGPLSSVVVDRDLLVEIGGFDESLKACQDWDLYIRCLEHTDATRVPFPLIGYFCGNIPRISRNHRERINARIHIHKRYAKGKLPAHKKHGYYINISDDLRKIGKNRLANRFYMAYCRQKKRPWVVYWALKRFSIYDMSGRKTRICGIIQKEYRSYYRVLFDDLERECRPIL